RESGAAPRSAELDATCGEHDHLQQQPAVTPALYVGFAVATGAVADRNLDDLAVQPRRPEEQIEVAEGVEVAEVAAPARDAGVVGRPQDLGAAQRVAYRLSEQPRERPTEELVAKQVEEAHGVLLHGVDEPHPVGEFAQPAREHLVEPWQVL